ncbi:hydrolase [Microbacterium sp. J1-1]|uniref:hydrolase n=1 Tax=Microbacterium sp. J1-1 TaxID=2992441 RepID=UPI002114038B|nr:hydrolase [Microbacterium sp. J1-1]UUE19977.1 hydrolase [Microbacterium sp. J1-1]
MHAATFFDGVGWREGVVELVDGRVRLSDGHSDADLPRLDGVVLGGFTDHHVHLQLVDHAQLSGSRLGRVVDLGGNPGVLRRLARGGIKNAPATSDSGTFFIPHPHPIPRALVVEFAGAFVTAPGGYPSDREWAPEGSVREVADERAAAKAVAEMAATGASCLKVTSNSTAGPIFSDDLFRTIVGLAASRSLPVVAHAEGPGEAQRVVALGAARLAHAPFTEHLDDEEIARQAASASWISTLAIHDGLTRTVAIDNVRRFHAAGGTVLYGTDLGNGPMPNDLNAREIAALREAGLHSDALLHALSPMDPLAPSATLLFLPGASPATADPLAARPLIPADLKV